jgi:hypothetical protein
MYACAVHAGLLLFQLVAACGWAALCAHAPDFHTCIVVFLDCCRFAAAGRLKQRLLWLAMLMLLCCCLLPEGGAFRTLGFAGKRLQCLK